MFYSSFGFAKPSFSSPIKALSKKTEYTLCLWTWFMDCLSTPSKNNIGNRPLSGLIHSGPKHSRGERMRAIGICLTKLDGRRDGEQMEHWQRQGAPTATLCLTCFKRKVLMRESQGYTLYTAATELRRQQRRMLNVQDVQLKFLQSNTN